jgi:ABC-type multidrug transport system fused ATPase/permease subunit
VMDAVETLHGSKTVVIVAHRLSTVAKCDRLYRLEKGRVVGQGSFEAMVGSPLSEVS